MQDGTNTTIEAKDRLRSLLEDMRRACRTLPSEYFYKGTADFVLREGQFFEPAPLPKNIGRKEIRQCFRNAREIAVSKGLPYVEGFALSDSLFPQKHAWNIDSQGLVIDTTWVPVDATGLLVGRAYMGVVFSHREILEWTGSLIDNWENGWPLLRKPWKPRASTSEP